MSAEKPVGIVLAGGASRRMGGNPKSLEALGDRTLLANAIERLAPQVQRVLVSGPKELRSHLADDIAVVADPFKDRRGPLAGILAGMIWCEENASNATSLVSVPVDTPFFPGDLAERLEAERPPEGNALARVGGKVQPAFGAWNVGMRASLQSFLLTTDTYKVLAFTDEHVCGYADFEDAEAFDNANTPDDLKRVRERAKA